jgi:hypothetical protein
MDVDLLGWTPEIDDRLGHVGAFTENALHVVEKHPVPALPSRILLGVRGHVVSVNGRHMGEPCLPGDFQVFPTVIAEVGMEEVCIAPLQLGARVWVMRPKSQKPESNVPVMTPGCIVGKTMEVIDTELLKIVGALTNDMGLNGVR